MREDIHTDDIEGIGASAGILTAAGARTSHAAVIARQLGKACLVGCRELRIDLQARSCTIGGVRLAEGEEITLDADSGRIYRGRIEVVRERPRAELAELAKWRAGERASRSREVEPGQLRQLPKT